MKPVSVFNGKQKEHSEEVLTLLYDYGPMSAWEMAARLTRVGGRISLHATLNKRLRALEEKGYVQRENKKWYLLFKGIIAVLLFQKKPKVWNPIWKEIFDNKAKIIEQHLAPMFGTQENNIHKTMKTLGLSLDDFDALVSLSKRIKTFMENGIDFDTVKIETLLSLVALEYTDLNSLLENWKTLWNPKPNGDQI
jgi:hypothetical protein